SKRLAQPRVTWESRLRAPGSDYTAPPARRMARGGSPVSPPTPPVQWDPPGDAASRRTPYVDGVTAEPGSRYRPAGTLATAATVGLAATIALYGIDVVWSMYGIVLLSDLSRVTSQQLVSYDDTTAGIGKATLVLFVLTGIAFLAWLHRLVANVPALG